MDNLARLQALEKAYKQKATSPDKGPADAEQAAQPSADKPEPRDLKPKKKEKPKNG